MDSSETATEAPTVKAVRHGGLVIVDLLIILDILVAGAAWLLDPLELSLGRFSLAVHWEFMLAFAILLISARVVIGRSSGDSSLKRTGLFEHKAFLGPSISVVSVFVFLMLFEGILAIAGFEVSFSPIKLEDAKYHRRGEGDAMIADDYLLWRYQPGAVCFGQKVNKLGFPEREVDAVPAQGTIRVICIGDSCTAGGMPPYSTKLHMLLTNAPPFDGRWESMHNAVHGYSVMQGLRMFRHTTRVLHPDVVTLYFGWNSHWLTGLSDRERFEALRPSTLTAFTKRLQRKRFYQFIYKMIRPAMEKGGERKILRVSLEEYEDALVRLLNEIREAGAVPLVITAPRASELSTILVHLGNGTSMPAIYQLHEQYVEMTRRTAEKLDAPVLDLAGTWSEGDGTDELFRDDGIHMNLEGKQAIAEEIHNKLAEPDMKRRILEVRSSRAGTDAVSP